MKHHATLCNEWIEMDRRALARWRALRAGMAYSLCLLVIFIAGAWCGWLAGVLHASRALAR
jgi:hypothetical protein